MSSRDEHNAKRLLAKADKILQEVDEAYIIQRRGHNQRAMPSFRPEEISLGATLGTGGFGIVSEIRKFTLDPDNEYEDPASKTNGIASENPQQAISSSNGSQQQFLANNDVEGSHYRVTDKAEEVSMNDHVHYDIKKARLLMEQRCSRKGTARYALKRLHGALSAMERARGMIDLAVEAKYLSVVWHPNIIKLRGIAAGNMMDRGFFIILDRLHKTLDTQINQWAKEQKKFRGGFLAIGRNKLGLKELLIQRLTVAYDLAAAFMYLHENRIVYRDIKPENIGFDVRGDVKVFDFGLCKSLSSKFKAKDDGYGYRLTGRAGSLPYMAPEVVRMETYDTKCDVFSFAILLWEILSLQQAFEGMSPTRFVEKVVVDEVRLKVAKEWPALTRLMIPEAWDNDPRKRPDMKRVAILIRGDLNDMSHDETVLHRTKHMRQRSDHSLQPDEISHLSLDAEN